MTEVTLRAMIETDLEHLTGGQSPYDDWGPSRSREVSHSRLGEDRGGLTIVADGQVAGHLSWHYRSGGPGGSSRIPSFGVWLAPSHRGRGIGTAAQRQLAELFFLHTNVNRLEASTDVENLAEQQALARAGFTQEGVMRGFQWRQGAYHDMYLYAMTRADWGPSPS